MSKQFYFKQFSLAQIRSLNVKNVLFQTIQFSTNTQFNWQKNLFQTIQFMINTQFTSVWPLDRTLSGATTRGLSGPGSDGSEGILRIPQSSSITGTSPSDCLVLYPGHSLGESYPSAEMQSVYSTAPADWTRNFLEI